MIETKNFSQALEALKAGGKVSRNGWNGIGMFLLIQTPDEHSKMTLPYIYLTFVNSEGTQRVPWLASQSDILASDWFVIPE